MSTPDNPFDFDRALHDWRARHLRSAALEPEHLDELESSLHDRYEENLIRGLPAAEAFADARDRVSPDPTPTGREYGKLTGLVPNQLRVVLRRLYSRWGFNLINFVCLATGIFTVALAVLYLQYETGYDRFVPEAEQKYRVGRNYRSQAYSIVGFPDFFSTTGERQLQQLEGYRQAPGVRSATQFMTFAEPEYVTVAEKKLPLPDLLETNTPATFLDYFGWTVIHGSAERFTSRPGTALLTESVAEQYFGSDWREAQLLGRRLSVDTLEYEIAGVVNDVPEDAHFTFSVALNRDRIDYWGTRLYVELDPATDPASVNRYIDGNIGRINPALAGSELYAGSLLQPITSLHLHSNLLYEAKPPGDVRYLYIIGIIAGIILLLTVTNYTNLAMAINAGRGREIGMRKLFGAGRGEVAGQFVIEAVVISLLTLPLVAVGLWTVLPFFNTLMGTAIAANAWSRPGIWVAILIVAVGVGLLAGTYPALVLSGKAPLQLLRGNAAGRSGRRLTLRKVVVGLQFALLVGLCSATLIVNRQFRFLQEKDLGFTRRGILYVNMDGDSTRFETFRQEIGKLPEVLAVGADGFMGGEAFNQTTYTLDGTAEVYDDANLVEMSTSSARLLNLQTSLPLTDEGPAVRTLINQTLAERLAVRENIAPRQLVGRSIILEPEYTNEETGRVGFPLTIAGTFTDINMFSLRQGINPMILTLRSSPRYVYWAAVRFTGSTPAGIRSSVGEVYTSLFPDRTFRSRLLAENLEELYRAEERISGLCILFSLVAFGVAVIGLIALTTFLTTLKRREIGIRRILGASTVGLLTQFNLEYLPLLGIAVGIAAPLTYLAMNTWLDGFAYRIGISPLLFVVAATVILLVTVMAVSLTTLRAVRTVPAGVLQGND